MRRSLVPLLLLSVVLLSSSVAHARERQAEITASDQQRLEELIQKTQRFLNDRQQSHQNHDTSSAAAATAGQSNSTVMLGGRNRSRSSGHEPEQYFPPGPPTTCPGMVIERSCTQAGDGCTTPEGTSVPLGAIQLNQYSPALYVLAGDAIRGNVLFCFQGSTPGTGSLNSCSGDDNVPGVYGNPVVIDTRTIDQIEVEVQCDVGGGPCEWKLLGFPHTGNCVPNLPPAATIPGVGTTIDFD
ncbi:unnamed protein product [Vitrella brassicaformis CCMP3155]|uniref:Sushi domain-containing protein n=2 Tax=Vitrella brassicaformis TaxID=1169539 RepID=A0A0G4GMB7_VITBC|nr:unnamed protein product [Vitrella brassicaformis CCMP3155]|eukprot:CEM31330.1 unnamed protein product [Vitrella brassicaformis CCMP3155]